MKTLAALWLRLLVDLDWMRETLTSPSRCSRGAVTQTLDVMQDVSHQN